MQISFSSVFFNIFIIALLVWVVVLTVVLITLSRRKDVALPIKLFWSAIIVFAPFAGLLVYIIYGLKRRL
ncbi:MAG: hypothetical protein ABIN91_20380 [Mucilaginibacter sp.]|uniref:hypothetical protein n=1 Tax=Mucilaginibacter sp. TaxID=1882438 RepID=UPI003267AAD3